MKDIPEHVLKHTLLLVKSISPTAQWAPQMLRDHADTIEFWQKFKAEAKGKVE